MEQARTIISYSEAFSFYQKHKSAFTLQEISSKLLTESGLPIKTKYDIELEELGLLFNRAVLRIKNRLFHLQKTGRSHKKNVSEACFFNLKEEFPSLLASSEEFDSMDYSYQGI